MKMCFGIAPLLCVLALNVAQAETPQEVVKEYQDKFSYSFDLPEKWEVVPVDKYQQRIEPLTDRAKVGIVLTVDILHPVFGSADLSVAGYQKRFLERLAKQGYPTQSAKPFQQLKADSQWSVLEFGRPGGNGKDLLLVTKKKDLIFMFQVVFIDNFDQYFRKYQKDIERIVNNAQLDVE